MFSSARVSHVHHRICCQSTLQHLQTRRLKVFCTRRIAYIPGGVSASEAVAAVVAVVVGMITLHPSPEKSRFRCCHRTGSKKISEVERKIPVSFFVEVRFFGVWGIVKLRSSYKSSLTVYLRSRSIYYVLLYCKRQLPPSTVKQTAAMPSYYN